MGSFFSATVVGKTYGTPVATIPSDPSALTNQPAVTPSSSPADAEVLNASRGNLTSTTDIASWGAAQARAGNCQAAEDALRDALQREPTNLEMILRLAELRRLHRSPAFVDTALEALRKGLNNPEVQKIGMVAQLDALYIPPPYGYEKAIELSKFLESSSYKGEPFVYLRMACAYAQKHSFEFIANPEAGEQAKKEAINALRRVVELAPDPNSKVRRVMRELLDPNDTIADRDFDSLKRDNDFQKSVAELTPQS